MSQALGFDPTFSEHSHVHYLSASLGVRHGLHRYFTRNEKAEAQEGQRTCSRSHSYFQTQWGPEPRGTASQDSLQGAT